MATKKSSSNKGGGGPPVTTVPVISGAEMTGVATGATKGLAKTAVASNISGGRSSAQETLSFLQGGGGVQSSAILSSLSDSEVKRLTKEAKTTLGQKQRDERTLASVDKRLASGKLKPGDREKLEAQKANLTTRIADSQAKVIALAQEETNLGAKLTENQTTLSSALKDALGPTYAEFEKVKQQLGQQGTPGALGQRFMDQTGQGYQAGNIGWNSAQASMADRTQLGAAPTAQRVAEIGRGTLGDTLMGRAQEMAGSTGRLNPQANRDAIQSARQAFAARGLATGGGAAAAELLNRDRFSRQRQFEDLAFASQAQQQDLARQQANASLAQQANLADLDVQSRFALTQGDMDQRRALFNATQAQQNNQFNTSGQLQAAGMQQENLRLGSQLNASLLGQAAGAERMYQDRGLGASIQRMDMETQLNPTMMALGMDPFGGRTAGTQAMGPAASMANTWATNATAANMFNANAQNWSDGQRWMMNNMPSMQSGNGGILGGLGGAALGAGVGALLAAPTGGMSLTAGALYGAGIGGGLGAGVGSLFGR